MKIPLNECANLVRLNEGEVVVLFEKEHYRSGDTVPVTILGDHFRAAAPAGVFRAAHFVEICMSGKFGPVVQWPTAAVEYVYPTKAPCSQDNSNVDRSALTDN